MNRAICLFVITILFVLKWGVEDVSAQATRTEDVLQGEVLDSESGEPLWGATVEIEENSRGEVTDQSGNFEFSRLDPGVYHLRVRAVGYRTIVRKLSHPYEGLFTIQLDPQLLEAGDVIVTASPLGRAIRYQAAQALDRRDIDSEMRVSMGETLANSPGVHMRSLGTVPARPVIRGMDGERILILENGERTGDFSATSADHAIALDPLVVDKVEVVRGPASLLYGSSALGGVVNLFTSEQPKNWQEGFDGTVSAQTATVNRMGAGFAKASYGGEHWAVSGSGLLRSADESRTPDGALPQTWAESYRFGSGIGYRSDGLQSGISISGLQNQYGVPGDPHHPDESLEIDSQRQSIRSETTIDIGRSLFETAELRLHGDYNRLDDLESDSEPNGEVHEGLAKRLEKWSAGGTMILRHRPITRFEGAVGVNTYYQDVQISGEEILAPNARQTNLAVFLYEEMKLNERISLQSGARLEHARISAYENDNFSSQDLSGMNRRSETVFSGSAGLNIRSAAGWETGMQIARAFRTPSLEELYSDAPHHHVGAYEIGNPNLKNEVSLGSDLFVRHRGAWLYMELSGYLNQIDHFVVYGPTGETDEQSGLPVYRYRAADARLRGFELITEFSLTDSWVLSAEMDYVFGEQQEQGSWIPLPFMPPFRTRVELTYQQGVFRLAPRMTMVRRQDRVAPGEDPTEGYLLVGVQAEYEFTESLRILFRVDNLLNTRYRNHLSRIEDRNYPMPGRSFNTLIRWDL